MDINTVNAILVFAGGLLAFLAALLPIAWRIWHRAVSENRHQRLVANLLNVLSLIFYASGLLARLAFHAYTIAWACLFVYLLLILWIFVRRPFEMSRGEVGITVLAIAFTLYLLSTWRTAEEVERLRQLLPQPTATPTPNQSMQRTASSPRRIRPMAYKAAIDEVSAIRGLAAHGF